jgi:protoporphyrinogen oxidase
MPDRHIVIIGAGFTGLSAAYELTRRGLRVTIVERDQDLGGLAASFEVNGTKLEKFYHHWFTSDRHVTDLVTDLGAIDQVVLRPTRTGMYYANQLFRLSKPLELLRFTPLSFWNRIRLGLLALRAQAVADWRELENETAEAWLRRLGGDAVYEVVWGPLLRGKFGDYASKISAVWFWNKLKLRGGSRAKGGKELLAYYAGGFAALADRLALSIRSQGGEIRMGCEVRSLLVENGRVCGVETAAGPVMADAVIATPALPVIQSLVRPHVPAAYDQALGAIEYIANICLVLELDRSLSNTYWLNVNDPGFPFVGVIEHTNFEPPEHYGGRHIVYLSKYLPETDRLYTMSDAEFTDFCIPWLQRMFPAFDARWVLAAHVWRARYSQPIVVQQYGKLIPKTETPIENFYIATMAQIYPEDRGTNYAIREGRRIGRMLSERFA